MPRLPYLQSTKNEPMTSELISWQGGGRSVQGKEAQVVVWGCLPVTGRDGDQRLEAALKVDLCRKAESGQGCWPPCLTQQPPDYLPSFGPSELSIILPLAPPGTPLRPSSTPGPWPHTPSTRPLCRTLYPLTPPGLNLVFFNLIDLDLEHQQNSQVRRGLPELPLPQSRGAPGTLSPLLTRGDR